MVGMLKGDAQLETFRFKWKIERFFADCESVGDHYQSSKFPIQYANRITNWFLRVYPKGQNEKDKNFIAIFLYFISEHEMEVTVDYEISILNEQSVHMTKKDTHTFKGPTHNWGWPKFNGQDSLETFKDGALIDDTLTISCDITFHSIQDDTTNFNGYNEYTDKIANGFDDYEKLLDSGSFTDVSFNVQDRKINVHKSILSCRSSVFEAMFNHDMKENKQNVVDITDIEYDVMKELFRFLYSGKVKNIEKIASELLIAADKYQVIELKALCEKTLYEKITVDNAIDYLKLSQLSNTIHLKRLAIKFVAAHHKDIVKKPEFVELDKNVMHQIIMTISDKN